MLTLLTMTETTFIAPEAPIERRDCARAFKPGTISVAARGADLSVAPLLEYNTQGARVVLKGEIRVNQRVDFLLSTRSGRLDGYARIAWTTPTCDGNHVAGLEFIDFTLR